MHSLSILSLPSNYIDKFACATNLPRGRCQARTCAFANGRVRLIEFPVFVFERFLVLVIALSWLFHDADIITFCKIFLVKLKSPHFARTRGFTPYKKVNRKRTADKLSKGQSAFPEDLLGASSPVGVDIAEIILFGVLA